MSGTIDEAAIAIHEIFLSLVKAGFTEKQALVVVASMLKGPVQS